MTSFKRWWPLPDILERIGVLLAFVMMLSIGSLLQAAERNVPGDYDTIQAAIDASQPGDTVLVEPGTWRETITLRSNIVLRGRETARTLLEGTGENPVISADGVADVRVSNFTFVDVSIGVRVSGNADIIIAGNVFDGGGNGTAVMVLDSAAAEISNNTFYDNGTAIDRAHDGVSIRNNMFYENSIAIAPAGLTANISYNGFLNNDNDGPVGTQAMLNKPFRFISTSDRDFHLRSSSEGIDEGDPSETDVIDGTRADMGAYGGPYADVTPFPVSGLSVESDGADSVTVKWSANFSYLTAGYKLYYGSDDNFQGNDAAEGPSPIDVGKVTSFRLTGLASPTPAGLGAPILDKPAPSYQALQLSWAPVSGAVGYKVSYGVDSVDEHEIDVGNSTSYRLTGLQNGVTYRVAVSAFSQAEYYFAVTVYDSTSNRNESARPGESRIKAGVGPTVQGPRSNEVVAFPEAIEPYPNLPDEGCFIATAAYGYYSAPQVQLLRDFRDRYLLTHAPGRAFVRWYYTHGPAAAQWLNLHPEIKPMVRTMLLPLIGIADLLLNGSLFYLVSLMMLCGLLVTMGALILRRKACFVPREE